MLAQIPVEVVICNHQVDSPDYLWPDTLHGG